jgi:hypothetical protein
MSSPSSCASCGLGIPALIEIAHIPDRRTAPNRTLPLCSLCHRAYDLGLTSQAEIEAVEAIWKVQGAPPHTLGELLIRWGERSPDWKLLHKGAQKKAGLKIRRRNAAKRAVATRRANASREA